MYSISNRTLIQTFNIDAKNMVNLLLVYICYCTMTAN